VLEAFFSTFGIASHPFYVEYMAPWLFSSSDGYVGDRFAWTNMLCVFKLFVAIAYVMRDDDAFRLSFWAIHNVHHCLGNTRTAN
jgi:hypothetical protein